MLMRRTTLLRSRARLCSTPPLAFIAPLPSVAPAPASWADWMDLRVWVAASLVLRPRCVIVDRRACFALEVGEADFSVRSAAVDCRALGARLSFQLASDTRDGGPCSSIAPHARLSDQFRQHVWFTRFAAPLAPCAFQLPSLRIVLLPQFARLGLQPARRARLAIRASCCLC